MITYEQAFDIELEKTTALLRGWQSDQSMRDIAECRAKARVVAERERLDREHVDSLADEALNNVLALQTKESAETRARLGRAKEELNSKSKLRDASAIEQAELTRIADEDRRATSLLMMLREEVARRETVARQEAVMALIADKSTQGAISQNVDALEHVLELYTKWPNANGDDGTRSYLIALIQGLRRLQPGNHRDSD